MSKILEMRDGIVAAIAAESGSGERFQGVHASSHGGEFDDINELKRYAKQTPAIIVAVLRVKSEYEGSVVEADCTMGAFIVTKHETENPQANGAIALVDNFMHFLLMFPGQDWGVDVSAAKDAIARNLYNKDLDKLGIAIWGVFWEQRVELEAPVLVELPDAEVVHVDYDLHPRDNDAELGDVIDAEDDIDLTA